MALSTPSRLRGGQWPLKRRGSREPQLVRVVDAEHRELVPAVVVAGTAASTELGADRGIGAGHSDLWLRVLLYLKEI
jgi:hypothetical protein